MISKDIKENKKNIINLFNNTSDLIIYEFETNSGIKGMVCYIEGLIDKNLLDRDIIKPLILELDKAENINKTVFVSQLGEIDTIDYAKDELPYGRIVIFFQSINIAYTIEINQWEKRAVEEPSTENVVRGPKEGFIEDILINKSLLRRKIRSNNLIFEDHIIGKQTKTIVSVAYINGVVNKKVLKEVKKRLKKINIDSILESGYIEELIEDHPIALLSTIYNTEKPDIVAGKMLEGRVAIFVDGTPHVLIMPRLFVEGMMAAEDYYSRTYHASFLRLIRWLSLFLTVYSLGIFVALQLYHQGMIPTILLISMAGEQDGVPFPIALEVIFMSIALTLVKESGLRLPKNIGSTVSIVGGLILGQAAVEAKLVSGVTVIVVSIVAISEFVVSDLMESTELYRLAIILLASFAGLFGVTCGFMIIITQMVSMESFGIPFMSPLAPKDWQALKQDGLIRVPIFKNLFRPKTTEKQNIRRQISPWRK